MHSGRYPQHDYDKGYHMKLTITFLLLSSFCAYANILPHTNIKIPTSIKNANLTEKRFNALIDQVVTTYDDTFRTYGMRRLIVNRKWEDGEINASAAKNEGTFLLNVYGGLGRYETLTDDGILLVLCHEIGHLIGGAPTYKPINDVSSEGQADYFSTAKCFKKIAKKYPRILSVKEDIHPFARIKCEQQFKEKMDKEVCFRSSLGQQSLAKTLSSLSKEEIIPQFDTPDPQERTFILFNGYPSIQCRIDTVFAGSICSRDENELLSFENYNQGVCSSINGDTEGVRPRCWYVPRPDKN